MGFPYKLAFPLAAGADVGAPTVSFQANTEIHEKASVQVTVADDSDIAYVRLEVHYPTGYYEVAYETGVGWGRFYQGSTIQTLEPVSGVATRYTLIRDLHWPTHFELKAFAKDSAGNHA